MPVDTRYNTELVHLPYTHPTDVLLDVLLYANKKVLIVLPYTVEIHDIHLQLWFHRAQTVLAVQNRLQIPVAKNV
jgi:hypothetical protein